MRPVPRKRGEGNRHPWEQGAVVGVVGRSWALRTVAGRRTVRAPGSGRVGEGAAGAGRRRAACRGGAAGSAPGRGAAPRRQSGARLRAGKAAARWHSPGRGAAPGEGQKQSGRVGGRAGALAARSRWPRRAGLRLGADSAPGGGWVREKGGNPSSDTMFEVEIIHAQANPNG
jgi:hypothetical protein